MACLLNGSFRLHIIQMAFGCLSIRVFEYLGVWFGVEKIGTRFSELAHHDCDGQPEIGFIRSSELASTSVVAPLVTFHKIHGTAPCEFPCMDDIFLENFNVAS